MDETICKFIPVYKDYHSLHIIHFVLESNRKLFAAPRTDFLHRIFLVTKGSGILKTPRDTLSLSPGALFFTFPSYPFEILSSSEDFQYMYISFLGTRGNQILDTLKIHSANFLFSDFSHLQPFWETCIHAQDSVLSFKSECALLYAFSLLGERLAQSAPPSGKCSISSQIKRFIDDHYCEPGLSLEEVSAHLKYNPKYLSTAFRKDMGITIIQYLHLVRVQHACSLMEEGLTNIGEIALQSGFTDSQYFSKVFRKYMSTSPKEHIRTIRNQRPTR